MEHRFLDFLNGGDDFELQIWKECGLANQWWNIFGINGNANQFSSAAQELDATRRVYLSSHSAIYGDDITIEYSDVSVIKEEIPCLESDVLNHNTIKWKTVFERTVENDTNGCDGLPDSTNSASNSESQNSSSSSELEEDADYEPERERDSDYDPEEAKTGVTQRKKIVIADRAPLRKTAGGLAVYDRDFITKLRSAKSQLNADRSAAFKERESNNGEIVIGMNFQRKSLEKLFYLRNACKKESRRNSQRRRDAVRPYSKYSKILSALDEKIKNLRGEGGETKTSTFVSGSEHAEMEENGPSEPENVGSQQRNLFDDLIKLSPHELHEVTGKGEVDETKTVDLKHSSGDLNKIIKRLQQRLSKNSCADSYEQADLEHKSHCSMEVSSHSLQENVKGSTSKTRSNQPSSKQNGAIFSRSCRQTRSSRRSFGFRQMQLGKRTNGRPSNLEKVEQSEVVPWLKELRIVLHRVDVGKCGDSSSLRGPIGSFQSSQKRKTHSQGTKSNAGSEISTRCSEELVHSGNVILNGGIATLHSGKSITTNTFLHDNSLQESNSISSANNKNLQDANSISSGDGACSTQRPVPRNGITSDLSETYSDSQGSNGHRRSEVKGYQSESDQEVRSPINNVTNSSDTPSKPQGTVFKAAKMTNRYGPRPPSLIEIINGRKMPKERPKKEQAPIRKSSRKRKSKVDSYADMVNPNNSDDEQEMEMSNSVDYDLDFRARKKQKRQVRYNSPPHLDLENYRARNERFRDVEEDSEHIRQDGDEIQFCKNLNSAMLRNRVLDSSESDGYFTVGGKNRPGVLMPSRGGGCARLRTYIKVMERGYYC